MTNSCDCTLSYEQKLNVRSELEVKNTSIQWEIKNFSLLDKKAGEFLESPTISTDDKKYSWSILVYPFGKSNNDIDFVSVYLSKKGKNMSATRYTLSILNSMKEQKFKCNLIFGSAEGRGQLVKRSFLLENKSHYLPNDVLTILVELKFMEDVIHTAQKELSPGFEDTLSEDFGKALADSRFSDVTLLVGEKEFKVHRVVLSVRSPVFAAMFSHKTEEAESRLVRVSEADPAAMEELLRYVYTGRTWSLKARAEEVLKAANYYDVRGLKELCTQELLGGLNLENALAMLQLADDNDTPHFKRRVMSFISDNAREVLTSQVWKQMEPANSDLVVEVYRAIAEKQLFFNNDN